MADKKQIYPPSVQDSLMQRIRALTKKGEDKPEPEKAEQKLPGKAEKREAPAWKAAVGYGPLVLRLGSDAGKPQLPNVTTLGQALLKGREKGTPIRSEKIESFDCWYAVGSGADRIVCQYALRRTGDRAEGVARRTVSDEAASYDRPFTVPAAALDGLQTLVKELHLGSLGGGDGEETSGTGEGCHLAVWYASGESIRCHDTRRCRLSTLQAEGIRRWFETAAGI